MSLKWNDPRYSWEPGTYFFVYFDKRLGTLETFFIKDGTCAPLASHQKRWTARGSTNTFLLWKHIIRPPTSIFKTTPSQNFCLELSQYCPWKSNNPNKIAILDYYSSFWKEPELKASTYSRLEITSTLSNRGMSNIFWVLIACLVTRPSLAGISFCPGPLYLYPRAKPSINNFFKYLLLQLTMRTWPLCHCHSQLHGPLR